MRTVDRIPLISDYSPERTFAWASAGPISARQALIQIEALARELAPGRSYLNLCNDRYLFTVAFAAICRAGGANLLPSSHNDSAVTDIRHQFPDAGLLNDEWVWQASLRVSDEPTQEPTPPGVPQDQCCAVVFTSGSTGQPTGHRKSWRELYEIARALEQRFLGDKGRVNIAATVPPQHMYGLETSVLPVLHSGCAAHARVPFLPWEVAAVLAEEPSPRFLVTTPMHLRACHTSATRLPEMSLIISATAPLPIDHARGGEALWGTPVCEIYGCTEAGSLATRRPAHTETWTLLAGLDLTQETTPLVYGQRLAEPVRLEDQLEVLDAQHFHLLGRSQDMIKLGGKRLALGELSVRLQRIEGVDDAAAFLPQQAREAGETRPAALVVAPYVSEETIRMELAKRVDPVFVPRPLVRVERLPRNAMGKLPHDDLEAMLRSAGPTP
jgi:acyl-coenzyme A synthetase/AMP-(fatty) acid ligase